MIELLEKINIGKLLKYGLYMLLSLIAQEMVLGQFRVFGVAPLILPACAVAMGMFGFMAGVTVLLWRLCGMECVGVSYLYPLTDGERHGLLRGLLHFPISMNAHRSPALCGEEQRRQA